MDAYPTAAAGTLPSSRSRSFGETPECEYDPRRIDKDRYSQFKVALSS